MPNYSYTAKDLKGKIEKGELIAVDRDDLSSKLRGKELFLLSIKEKDSAADYKKIKSPELSDFCRQIGTMLAAGIPLVRSLGIMLQRDHKPAVEVVYRGLYDNIQQGVTLSDAMSKQGGAFPELLINMIRAGEANGQLDRTTMKMADHYEKEHRLNNKIRSAMTYPIILLVITLGVMVLIFTAVLPTFFELFEGIELPLPTQFVIWLSRVLTNQWYMVLIVAVAVIAGVVALLQVESVRMALDHFKLRIPKIGKLLKIIYTARFARMLSSLYGSGLSMVNALQISANTIGNRYIQSQFEAVNRQVRSGVPLSTAISNVDGFDPKLASTVFIGEETGKLDDMLNAMSDSYDYESEMAIQRLTTYIEPILIVFMAVVVGFIMISVMLPIYTLYQNIG